MITEKQAETIITLLVDIRENTGSIGSALPEIESLTVKVEELTMAIKMLKGSLRE